MDYFLNLFHQSLTIKNERDDSLHKIMELQDSIRDLCITQSNLIAYKDNLKAENDLLVCLLKEYRERFDEAMHQLVRVATELAETQKALDEMMNLPEQWIKD